MMMRPMRPMFPRKTENDIETNETQLHSLKSYFCEKNVKNPKHVSPTDTPAEETTKRIFGHRYHKAMLSHMCPEFVRYQ